MSVKKHKDLVGHIVPLPEEENLKVSAVLGSQESSVLHESHSLCLIIDDCLFINSPFPSLKSLLGTSTRQR
jgi:hypothetical protein